MDKSNDIIDTKYKLKRDIIEYSEQRKNLFPEKIFENIKEIKSSDNLYLALIKTKNFLKDPNPIKEDTPEVFQEPGTVKITLIFPRKPGLAVLSGIFGNQQYQPGLPNFSLP